MEHSSEDPRVIDPASQGYTGARHLEVHFEIASQCGLDCRHCSSESGSEGEPVRLDAESIARFAESLGSGLGLYISLTGGEPLTSGQFLQVSQALRRVGSICRMGFFTSGCIVTEAGMRRAIDHTSALRLREAGIDFCYISLYSHLGAVHDWVTRVPGSHECSLRSIAALLEIGIDARVHFVPLQQNQSDVGETISFLDQMRVPEVRFLRLVKHGRARRQWQLIGLSRHEQAALLREAVRTVDESGLSIEISAAGFPELMDCRPLGQGRLCQAGISLLYVDRDGRVFPCACKKRDERFCLGIVGESEILRKVRSVRREHNLKCLQDA